MFVPLSTIAFATLPVERRTEATAMFTRQEYRSPFTVPNVGGRSTAAQR